MHSLPETISYSPLHVPSLARPLLRRDLYDARFQLISQHQEMDVIPPNGVSDHVMTDKESQDGETEYVDAGTDLIPGVYEGGLKTWEGGVDLVEVLNGVQRNTGGETEGGNAGGEWVRGSRVLEVSSLQMRLYAGADKYNAAWMRDSHADGLSPSLPPLREG